MSFLLTRFLVFWSFLCQVLKMQNVSRTNQLNLIKQYGGAAWMQKRTIVGSTGSFAAALVAFDSCDESLACTAIWSCHGHQEGAFCTAKWWSRWWFQIFFIFTPTGGSDPIRLSFLKWVVQPPTSGDFQVKFEEFVLPNLSWKILSQRAVEKPLWSLVGLLWLY